MSSSKQQDVEAAMAVGEVMTQGKGSKAPERSPESDVNDARISFRKTITKRVVNALAALCDAHLDEKEEAFVLSAPYIKFTRSEVEGVVGPLSDAKWRTLFINKSGEVREFNNYVFAIGTPEPVEEKEEPVKETVQLNIRIDKSIKDLVEKYRAPEYLDLTQNAFVEEALKEFCASIEKQLV